MNEPDDNRIGNDSSPHDLEGLLAGALDALEAGGEEALARFVAVHPEQAPQLRVALADLHRIELLKPAAAGVPVRLGEFRIREQLGAGGMGVVYLAEQTSLGREVALKVVRPELLFFDGARERFRREIDTVAKLEHPAIVPILATGIADGIPYYAMPRIRGRSAEATVKALAGRQPAELAGADLRDSLADAAAAGTTDTAGTFAGSWWQAVVRLVRQGALGIHHAHTRGVLHRDLKPSNLMLTADGRAIVLDFGLAQARGDARLTRTGAAPGSPAYMAPEQVRGEPADERTDVYGLAATLHCLLALRPPFVADDPEVLRGLILAGAHRGLERAAAPTELRLVLATAMDVDRVHRYGSASAFADDLQAVLDGRPILARALPASVRLRRFAQRHRVLATATFAVAVFLVVLPVVLLWQQHAANRTLAAQVQRSDASVRVSVDAVETLLANVASDHLRNLPAAQEVAAQLLRDAMALFERLAGDAVVAERVHKLSIRALQHLATAESSLGRRDAALAAAERALGMFDGYEPTPPWRLCRAQVRRQLAGLLLDEPAIDRAEPDKVARVATLVDEAQVELRALSTEPTLADAVSTELGLCAGMTARLAMGNGDVGTTERALRLAIAAIARGAGTNTVVHGVAQINLVRFLKETRHLDEGLRLADEVLAAVVLPTPHEAGWPVPRMIAATAQQERAAILVRLGRPDDAVAAARHALDLFDGLHRDYPDEPSVLRQRGAVAHNLALILSQREQWAAVRPLLEGAGADQMRVLARNPQDAEAIEFLTNHRRSLAVCLYELEDFVALEPVARALGQMPGGALSAYWAAIGLLRCAEPADATAAKALRGEAVELLLESNRRGRKLDLDDPRIATVRNDPRLQTAGVRK